MRETRIKKNTSEKIRRLVIDNLGLECWSFLYFHHVTSLSVTIIIQPEKTRRHSLKFMINNSNRTNLWSLLSLLKVLYVYTPFRWTAFCDMRFSTFTGFRFDEESFSSAPRRREQIKSQNLMRKKISWRFTNYSSAEHGMLLTTFIYIDGKSNLELCWKRWKSVYGVCCWAKSKLLQPKRRKSILNLVKVDSFLSNKFSAFQQLQGLNSPVARLCPSPYWLQKWNEEVVNLLHQ